MSKEKTFNIGDLVRLTPGCIGDEGRHWKEFAGHEAGVFYVFGIDKMGLDSYYIWPGVEAPPPEIKERSLSCDTHYYYGRELILDRFLMEARKHGKRR